MLYGCKIKKHLNDTGRRLAGRCEMAHTFYRPAAHFMGKCRGRVRTKEMRMKSMFLVPALLLGASLMAPVAMPQAAPHAPSYKYELKSVRGKGKGSSTAVFYRCRKR